MIPLQESKYEKMAKSLASEAAGLVSSKGDPGFDASGFLIKRLSGSGLNVEETKRVVERFNVNLFKSLYRDHVPDSPDAGDMTYPLADPDVVIQGIGIEEPGIEESVCICDPDPGVEDRESELLLSLLKGDRDSAARFLDVYRDHGDPVPATRESGFSDSAVDASKNFESWLIGERPPQPKTEDPGNTPSVITVDEALGDLIRNMRVLGIGQESVRRRARIMFDGDPLWPRINIALTLTPELKNIDRGYVNEHPVPREITVSLARLAEAIERSESVQGN